MILGNLDEITPTSINDLFDSDKLADNVSPPKCLRCLYNPHSKIGFARTFRPYLQSRKHLHMDVCRAQRRHHLGLSSNHAYVPHPGPVISYTSSTALSRRIHITSNSPTTSELTIQQAPSSAAGSPPQSPANPNQ